MASPRHAIFSLAASPQEPRLPRVTRRMPSGAARAASAWRRRANTPAVRSFFTCRARPRRQKLRVPARITPIRVRLPTVVDWPGIRSPTIRAASAQTSRLHPPECDCSRSPIRWPDGDLPARLAVHNAGQNRSTAPWRPWVVDVSIEFRTEVLASRFESYLKSGAGHAFALLHFVDRQ